MPNIWGDLPKSQVDPQTIAQAIAELIQIHKDDPDAHLETGQSLQSHKASEIIDHLAHSIVSDKLREWIEVFAVGSFNRNDFHWFTIFESLDGFASEGSDPGNGQVQNGIDYIILQSGTVNGYFWTFLKSLVYAPVALTFEKNRKFRTKVRITTTTNQEFWIYTGLKDENLVGFHVVNNKLYGVTCNMDATLTSVELKTLTGDTTMELICDFITGVRCDFYIDGVLINSILTDLPNSVDNGSNIFRLSAETATGANRNLYLSYWDFWQGI